MLLPLGKISVIYLTYQREEMSINNKTKTVAGFRNSATVDNVS